MTPSLKVSLSMKTQRYLLSTHPMLQNMGHWLCNICIMTLYVPQQCHHLQKASLQLLLVCSCTQIILFPFHRWPASAFTIN